MVGDSFVVMEDAGTVTLTHSALTISNDAFAGKVRTPCERFPLTWM